MHEADQSFLRAQDRLHSTRGTKLDHGVLAVFSGTFLIHTTGVLTVLVFTACVVTATYASMLDLGVHPVFL